MNCETATAAELDALVVTCYASAQAANVDMQFSPTAQRWFENKDNATRMALWLANCDETSIQTQGWAQAGLMSRFAPTLAAIRTYAPTMDVMVQTSAQPSGVDWTAAQIIDMVNTYIAGQGTQMLSTFYTASDAGRWAVIQTVLQQFRTRHII
jgi:hypothetical protein